MQKIVVIVGQTSSGKSDLAINLAKEFNGEIISADSRQVYKGLNWCSGKVSKEEMQEAKHHLLDIAEIGDRFTLYDFQTMAYEKIDELIKNNKLPIIVGGTGLYTRSIVEGYDLSKEEPNEELRKSLEIKSRDELLKMCNDLNIDVNGEVTNRKLIRLLEKNGEEKENKPRYKVLQLGLMWDREEIYKRIETRLKKRMPFMIEEIKSLIENGYDKEFLLSLGLEAKHIIWFLDGKYKNFDEFFEELFKEERHFAKRQNTWYNKEKNIVWLDAKNNLFENAKQKIREFLTNN